MDSIAYSEFSDAERKTSGSYYTPDPVVTSLVRWAIRSSEDRLLDPSCGDGRFIAAHRNSFGVEQNSVAAAAAMAHAPWALVHEGDFFTWAAETHERFHCAAGNPPFIRYQTFSGESRKRALDLCGKFGAKFSGLSSSWAPFLVAAASLLRPGGRMAFVVPAEIGHAPYAKPLVEFLVANFGVVHVTAVKEKLFKNLSEDCWLLYADEFGTRTNEIRFSSVDRFESMDRPPEKFVAVSVFEWRNVWSCRLRPFLMTTAAREHYRAVASRRDSVRLNQLARVGIGYVSGANDFFHLKPSEAEQWNIPRKLLHPTVRNGRALPQKSLTSQQVETWERNDEPILLLRVAKNAELPASVSKYLDSEAGRQAREAYKCRMRDPWYSVPDVQVPDYFLTYMSGVQPNLVRNDARCTCTNSVHSVRLNDGVNAKKLLELWDSNFVRLSCELEGHPLGGGMLKLEPREAGNVVLPSKGSKEPIVTDVVEDALSEMRSWRHYG